jgi:hypothetical protein
MSKVVVQEGQQDSQVNQHGKSPARLPVNAFLGQVPYGLFSSKDEKFCAQRFEVYKIAIFLRPRTVREPFFMHRNIQLHTTGIKMGQESIR